MGEGHIENFSKKVKTYLIAWFICILFILSIVHWLLHSALTINFTASTIMTFCIGLVAAGIYGTSLTGKIIKPTAYLAQSIQHIAPSEHMVAAPNIDELTLGHELVESLTRQVYAYATQAAASDSKAASHDLVPASLFDQLPLSIIGLDKDASINLTNSKTNALVDSQQITGLRLDQVFIISMADGDQPINDWLKEVSETSIVNLKVWQKVEIKTINHIRLGYFDVAVSYNKDSASGVEVVIALSDHSEVYAEEIDSVSFIALAVHEMRTPVTIMRGYIEAFEEELNTNLTPQLADDIRKMNASAETLSSFVSNILNVARINEGQLSLNLREENWNDVLPQIVDNLRNRAAAYGKQIELRMEPNMPTVAADRMTIGEVVTNLVENAIKYAPDSSGITIISRPNQQGLIETTVQDLGVGIPESVMPHLFTKFYRNHRNRGQIGGTGLGLYLSKTIMNAHQGNIWAQSKEGEGSTFGFTLLPYSQLATELQSEDNSNITRGSHGWIKNHSMQRR